MLLKSIYNETNTRKSNIITGMTNITYRLGELFAGPGGIALGAKHAKVVANGVSYLISQVWATDYDTVKFRNGSLKNQYYRKNISQRQ